MGPVVTHLYWLDKGLAVRVPVVLHTLNYFELKYKLNSSIVKYTLRVTYRKHSPDRLTVLVITEYWKQYTKHN